MNQNLNIINKLNNHILGNIKPDLIFLHTVKILQLKRRIQKRKKKNRYDKFDTKFYDKVQKGYIKMLKKKKNVEIIDTNKTIRQNKFKILKKIEKII